MLSIIADMIAKSAINSNSGELQALPKIIVCASNLKTVHRNVGWLVGWGFTSHSAIFQLYSNGTVVQFPNFDLLPGTHFMGS